MKFIGVMIVQTPAGMYPSFQYACPGIMVGTICPAIAFSALPSR
jgi:hypothetical protein